MRAPVSTSDTDFLAQRWSRLPNLRELHLISSELFDVLCTLGYTVTPGDLGENVTTKGLKLEYLPLGTKLRLGQGASLTRRSMSAWTGAALGRSVF
jgi:hypothetical protein